ncbi:unnamed protein product [Blepharisma stoltei]|uniref:Aquaporin n=1 Tax=Blepharisma stoltei TaxID=1481888 RepID=A0AAU9JC06_9CILI|nr:unnamed protein product [Blepharisma stoltei]
MAQIKMNLLKKLCAEAYATALLTLVIVGKNLDGPLVGCAFWMCIQGTNMIHSFHFNPCVQIASIIHKKALNQLTNKDRQYLLWSIFAQIIGAIPGVFAAWWIYDSDFYYKTGHKYNDAQKFFAEMLFSVHFILCTMGITFWPDNKLIGSLVVSGALTAGIETVGHISGACFNPTICFTVNIIQGIRTGDSEHFEYLWLYFTAPVIAIFISAGLACIIHFPPEKTIPKLEEVKEKKRNKNTGHEVVETVHSIDLQVAKKV